MPRGRLESSDLEPGEGGGEGAGGEELGDGEGSGMTAGAEDEGGSPGPVEDELLSGAGG
jgi:hypothetical protein